MSPGVRARVRPPRSASFRPAELRMRDHGPVGVPSPQILRPGALVGQRHGVVDSKRRAGGRVRLAASVLHSGKARAVRSGRARNSVRGSLCLSSDGVGSERRVWIMRAGMQAQTMEPDALREGGGATKPFGTQFSCRISYTRSCGIKTLCDVDRTREYP